MAIKMIKLKLTMSFPSTNISIIPSFPVLDVTSSCKFNFTSILGSKTFGGDAFPFTSPPPSGLILKLILGEDGADDGGDTVDAAKRWPSALSDTLNGSKASIVTMLLADAGRRFQGKMKNAFLGGGRGSPSHPPQPTALPTGTNPTFGG